MSEKEGLILNKKNEYFLSIAKIGRIHSFMMLGVIQDGEPKLLARVGKWGGVTPGDETMKMLGTGALARIMDEGISRKTDKVDDINHQSYDITYEQVKDFLGLIAELETKQHDNPAIKKGIEGEEIKCYVPDKESKDSDIVKFNYKDLKQFSTDKKLGDEVAGKATPAIVEGAQKIKIGQTTCRTTSKNIVEAVLGFETDVSEYFFVSPKHRSKLKAGQPDKDTFYILPSPPNTTTVSPEQASLLKKLYKRMEEIPKLNPESPETRKKFDALKSM